MKGTRIAVSRFLCSVIAACLLAGLIWVTLAPAQAPSRYARPHLLLVPDEPRAERALSDTDARVVARYDDFTLVEAAAEDDHRLRDAGAVRRDDMRKVRLGGDPIDPLTGGESLADKGAQPKGDELVLLQFVGPVKDAWLERLRHTGGRVVGYAAQNAYLVHARGQAVDRVADLVGADAAVRAAVAVEAGDKFDGSRPRGAVAVLTVAGERGQDARDRALGMGSRLRAASHVAGVTTQFLRLSDDEVAELANDPAVLGIEPWSDPELLDERASQIAAANLTAGVPTQPNYLAWLGSQGFPTSTFGFTIDVTDEGFDNGSETDPDHADFYEDGLASGTDRVDYATDYTSDVGTADGGAARDCSGHGTNVASIATGFNDLNDGVNNDQAGFNHGLGVAPQAQLGASKIFACDGSFDGASFTSVTSAAHAAGARISNNSWGFSSNPNTLGAYTTASREYDTLVRDARPSLSGNQQMVEVFAAGNSGEGAPGSFDEGYASVSAPATAKNVIAVGASENVRSIGLTDGCGVPDSGANHADDIIDFSSRGPTDDLRLKPDLVAPGTHMLGARPTHDGYTGNGSCFGQEVFPADSDYNLLSGTSQAAPVVAGAAALIRDWYRREHGGGSVAPSPALTKAILANTAADVAGGGDGKGSTVPPPPSMDAGWGRVDLAAIFGVQAREFVDQTELFDESGQSFVRSYEVPSAAQPVRVTLAWTDAVPATTAVNAYVNDLDLEVSAGGRRYLGNVLSGGQSVTGGTPDTRNNLESVVLPAGAAAKIAVKVRGTAIVGDGVPNDIDDDPTDQDFALVVSNANEAPSPVLAGDETRVADSGPGADGDGALEPGESFALEQDIRNDGDSDATGIDGTMSGDPDLTFTSSTSSYDDVLAGGVETNSTQFTGQLGAAATCGDDVDATLSLSTDQGPEEVPIVLPTGGAGAPDPQSINHGFGLAIPDDSSSGVTSTLTIPTPGRIKDLDVTIGQITHGWVGDLVIDLTGPDGTTVTLARHPGGPDNNGKNFVGTVFDDEATTNISSGSAPYTGSFRPQNDQLSRFDGKNKQGNWQLRVRDLFESETGSLVRWGTSTSSAVCDPPETMLLGGPSEGQAVASSSATFDFSGTAGTNSFECSLDGQQFEPCLSPKSYANLGQGSHSFAVRAVTGDGEADQSPATRTWSVDTLGPAVDIDAPAQGATLSDQTPTLNGSAGTAPGDLPGVALRIHSGASTAGAVVQSLTPTRSGDSWTVVAGSLPEGTYTARAEQADSLGNVGAATSTFTIDLPSPPPPVAPSFLLAPAEERLADALAGRFVVTAACASACRAQATLKDGAVSMGSGVKRLSRAGTAHLRVWLTRKARAALRRRARQSATLRVTLYQGGDKLALSRKVSLRRSAGLRRIPANGMRFWTVCSERCPLSAKLTLAASTARRIGLRPKGSARMSIASARTTVPARRPAQLTLRVRKEARKALRRARKVRAMLETNAGSNPRRTAKRSLTLRH